jgi:hypothetical protein
MEVETLDVKACKKAGLIMGMLTHVQAKNIAYKRREVA